VPRRSKPNRQQKQALVRLGENIRRERRRLGLTQAELAERAGLHPRVLQKMESAQSNILATTLARLQSVLQCPWELLMASLDTTESVEAWLRRMEAARDPDWLVFMQNARAAWEGRAKPSPGKITVPPPR
jgi:transcriptional regulator with XRE-family HTH domain